MPWELVDDFCKQRWSVLQSDAMKCRLYFCGGISEWPGEVTKIAIFPSGDIAGLKKKCHPNIEDCRERYTSENQFSTREKRQRKLSRKCYSQ